LPPLSAGASKLGEVLNVIRAVLVSDLVISKSVRSAPDETRIVAAVAEVAMFSAAENEEDEVKVGAVVSGV
jgi:hypothetical protein